MNRTPATWPWDDVRFFLAVARTGSLSGAARTLGVGHVTVGRRIALLERRLGVTLLSRTPNGYATTSAGQAILQHCAAMETAALAYQLIAPAIATLRRAHPDLQIDLTLGVRSLDIARRDADLAVRFARPVAPDLICRKLGEVGFSLYASRRYLAKTGIPERGHGLAGYDVIT